MRVIQGKLVDNADENFLALFGSEREHMRIGVDDRYTGYYGCPVRSNPPGAGGAWTKGENLRRHCVGRGCGVSICSAGQDPAVKPLCRHTLDPIIYNGIRM
jgi:hypothetical protein